MRTGAEAIAFTGGEEETKVSLNEDFRRALRNQARRPGGGDVGFCLAISVCL